MVRINLIRNNKVTTKDVNIAIKTFGPDIGTIKGKTTRQKPPLIIDNHIEIPEELVRVNREVTMSIGGLSVNSLKFLTTISHNIFYRTAQYLSNATAINYEKCIDEIKGIYKKGGFKLNKIHCNNKFQKTLDSYTSNQDPPINVNYAPVQDHIP